MEKIPTCEITGLQQALNAAWGALEVPARALVEECTRYGFDPYTDPEDVPMFRAGLVGKRFDEVEVWSGAFYIVGLLYELPPHLASYYLGSYLHYVLRVLGTEGFFDDDWLVLNGEMPTIHLIKQLGRLDEELARELSSRQIAVVRDFIKLVLRLGPEFYYDEPTRAGLGRAVEFIDARLAGA